MKTFVAPGFFNSGSRYLTRIDQTVNLLDDQLFELGTGKDIVLLHRSSALNADTALTDVDVVVVGSPDTIATAADSLIISNATASGDVHIMVNKGGNSHTAFLADGSTGDTILNASSGQSVDLYVAGTKEYDFGATAADFNSNNVTNMGTLNTYTILNMARNSQWVFPEVVSGTGTSIGTVGRGATANFGDNDVAEQAAFFSAYAPTGFTTLTKAVLRIVATAVDTGSSGNVRIEFFTNVDADGEALNGTQVNVGGDQYGLTLNVWDDLDIEDLGCFAGLAAGDLIQFRVQRVPNNVGDTVETVSIAGVLLEWT